MPFQYPNHFIFNVKQKPNKCLKNKGMDDINNLIKTRQTPINNIE